MRILISFTNWGEKKKVTSNKRLDFFISNCLGNKATNSWGIQLNTSDSMKWLRRKCEVFILLWMLNVRCMQVFPTNKVHPSNQRVYAWLNVSSRVLIGQVLYFIMYNVCDAANNYTVHDHLLFCVWILLYLFLIFLNKYSKNKKSELILFSFQREDYLAYRI